MSNVSPVPGAATSATSELSGSSSTYPQSSSQQHSSTPSHHHHPSSQDEAASGMAHTSFDSVASHQGHQSQQQQQPPPQQQQQHQQQHPQAPQQQQQAPHPASNGHPAGNPWAGHPQQQMHYGAYPSHTMYSSPGYYPNPNHSNGSANMSNGYAAYSVQPHQGQPQQAMYANHGPGMNGSAHHSGSSTPNSTTPYPHHPHPSMGGMLSNQPYHPHHISGGYYGPPSNGMMSSPSYSSGPQYGAQLPVSGRHRVTTTLWEDEGTLCFQVDARGVCVARRHDNNMINGTKLLNVCGMSRGKRDGILKNEKERVVVKVGAMHLKGVWITFLRGRTLAEQNDILDVLYPLFETNIQSFLYHPDNYPRTAAVMAAAQERNTHRRAPGNSPGNPYPPQQRAASHSAGPVPGPPQQPNAPPLMRANTTPGGALMSNGGAAPNGPLPTNYHHQSNGYSSAPNHPQQQHSPYAQTMHTVSTRASRDEGVVSSAPVKSEDVNDAATATAGAQAPGRMHYYGEDIKAPLSESTQLNSSSPYAYPPATNVPLKHHNQNTLLHHRSEGDDAGIITLPPWTYRGNGYGRQQ